MIHNFVLVHVLLSPIVIYGENITNDNVPNLPQANCNGTLGSTTMKSVELEASILVFDDDKNKTAINVTSKDNNYGGFEIVDPPDLGTEKPGHTTTTYSPVQVPFFFPDNLPDGFRPITNSMQSVTNSVSHAPLSTPGDVLPVVAEDETTTGSSLPDVIVTVAALQPSTKATPKEPVINSENGTMQNSTSDVPTESVSTVTSQNFTENYVSDAFNYTLHNFTENSISDAPNATTSNYTEANASNALQSTWAPSPLPNSTENGISTQSNASSVTPGTSQVMEEGNFTYQSEVTTNASSEDSVLAAEAETEKNGVGLEGVYVVLDIETTNSTNEIEIVDLMESESTIVNETVIIGTNATAEPNVTVYTTTETEYWPTNSTEFCIWSGDLTCSSNFDLRCYGAGSLDCHVEHMESENNSRTIEAEGSVGDGQEVEQESNCSLIGDIVCNRIPTTTVCAGRSKLKCYEKNTDDKWMAWEIYVLTFVALLVFTIIAITTFMSLKKWKESRIHPNVNSIEVQHS